jgi:hypothetical protein
MKPSWSKQTSRIWLGDGLEDRVEGLGTGFVGVGDDDAEAGVHGDGQADLFLDLPGQFQGGNDENTVVWVRGEETLEVVGSVLVKPGTVDDAEDFVAGLDNVFPGLKDIIGFDDVSLVVESQQLMRQQGTSGRK